MDYRSSLKQYLNRRVCVELNRRCAVWGTLTAIRDDCLQLAGSVMLRDPDDQGWFAQIQRANAEVADGPHYAETIVRLEDILAVTRVDDVTESDSSLANIGASSAGESLGLARVAQFRSNGTLSAALSRLATGVRIDTPHNQEPDVPELDRLEIELGVGLIRLADPSHGGDLLERIPRIRRAIAQEMGVAIPKVRIRDNIRLDSREYRFLVEGQEVARGDVYVDGLLAIESTPATGLISGGIETREPVYGRKAYWIEERNRDQAELLGYTTCEPSAVMVTHLKHITKRWTHRLITCEDVQRIVEAAAESHPTIVKELVPGMMAISAVHRFLMWLLEERVSIRNVVRILESLAYHAANTACRETILKGVRADLGRDICGPLAQADNRISCFSIPPEIEEELCHHLNQCREFSNSEAFAQLTAELELIAEPRIAVVGDADLRRPLFLALSRRFPDVTVLATAEISAQYEIVSAG